MTWTVRAAILLAVVFSAPHASAQDRSLITLRPANAPRWDAAGQAGWFGANKTTIAPDWNDWSEAAVFAASAGYYFTPNFKIEIGAATTTTGEVESLEQIGGGTFPTFRSRRHRFRSTTVSTVLAYQFLDNAWFHPFVGVGIEARRERVRIDAQPYFAPLPGGRPGVLIPGPPSEVATTYAARPLVTVGFKWYVSERVFVRSDIRSTFSTDRAESAEWRAGFGFDF